MSNPIIQYDETKKLGAGNRPRFTISLALFEIINNLPGIEANGKILLFSLLAYPIGYEMRESELLLVSGMSEAILKRQRKKLAELGYIKYVPYKKYYIDIDAILDAAADVDLT